MELTILFLWLALTRGSLGQAQSNYAQCGGAGYNGGTACGSGFSCQKQNDYYWQCLPGSSSSSGLQQSGGQGAIAQYGLCGGTTYSGGGQCQSGLVCLCSDRTKSFCQPPDWKAGSDCQGSGSQGNSQPNYVNTPNTLVPVTTPRPINNFYGVQPSASQPAAASTPSPAAVGGGTTASTSHYYDGTAGSCGCHVPGDKNTMSAWQLNPKPGWFSAAGSAKLFGSTAGTGNPAFCGTGCGSCYRLSTTGQTPPGEGNPPAAGVSFNVILTNLCPADQSAKWCNVPNQYGYSYHFDIMSQGYPMGLQNPLVTYSPIDCPSDLVTLMGQCQCQNGKDTGR